MAQSLKITRGSLKGKALKMPPDVKGNAHITPGIIKEAIFQVIDGKMPDCKAAPFFDLCAGSGQMGFEAFSLGYPTVHLSEVNQGRLRFLAQEMARLELPLKLHKRDFRRMPSLMHGYPAVVAYLDPPYSFWNKEKCESIDRFFFNLVCTNRDTERGSNDTDSKDSKAEYHAEDLLRRALVLIQGPYFYDHSVFENQCIANRIYSLDVETRDYRGNRVTVLDIRLKEQISD